MTSHSYEWVVAVEATCVEAGERRYTCKKCGNVTKYDTVPAPGHNWKTTSTVDSTCAKTGTKTYKCSRCLKTKTETIAKKSHTFATVTTVQATCTTAGESATKCSQCGYISDTQKIAPLGHDWKLTSTVDSTCAKAGTKTYKCSRCSNTKTETIAKKSHVYQWTTVTAPTEKAVGSEKNACKNCGAVAETRELYLISFYANGGKNPPANQIKKQGVNLTIPSTIPTRTDYKFLGWSAASNSNVILYKPEATCVLNQNLKLYAVWESKYCTVKYDLNNGTGKLPADVTVNRGATVTVPSTNITRTGFWFLGWAESKTATKEQYKAGSKVVADKEVKTLYAVWLIRKYMLSFNANGGENAPAPKLYEYGATAVIPYSGTSREGYYFMGWNTDPSLENAKYKKNSTIVMTGDVELYAIWSAKPCIVEFDANKGDGKVPDTIVSKYDKTVVVGKTSVKREGYYFMGWSTDPKADTKEYGTGSKITLKGDLKLYAVWVPMTWTLSYSSNGVSARVPSSQSVKTDQSVNVSKMKVQNDDYVFLGWSLDKDAKEASYTGRSSISVKKDTVLYAVWKHADCTLTFSLNGGASGAPAKITAEYGATVSIPSCPSIKHSIANVYFLGWSTTPTDYLTATTADVSFVSRVDVNYKNTITLEKNTTLYAVWRHYHSFDSVRYNEKTGGHEEHCIHCKQWISTSHSIKTYALYEKDENNGVGYHVERCVNERGELCGYYGQTEYCVNHVKWTYFHGTVKNQDDKWVDIYVRTGTCSECNAKVTEMYLSEQGVKIRPSFGNLTLGAVGVALIFAPEATWTKVVGGVLSVVSFVVEGVSVAKTIKQYNAQCEFEESLNPDDLDLEPMKPDAKRIQDFGTSATDPDIIYLYDIRDINSSEKAPYLYAVTPAQ